MTTDYADNPPTMSYSGHIVTLFLIIGGELVQDALAHSAGTSYIPMPFSFGWVAYMFQLILSMTKESRLMPTCDYPCKAINLSSGYARECKSWLLGRFLSADTHHALRQTAGKNKQHGDRVALQVNVYDWQDPKTTTTTSMTWREPATILVLALQFGLAAIPWIESHDWFPFLILCCATVLSHLVSTLPQWTAERFACRTKSKSVVALTEGNGSPYVAIIRSRGIGLNLEDLAGGRGPLMQSTWLNLGGFISSLFRGIPFGVWLTRVISTIVLLGWTALLPLIANMDSETAPMLFLIAAIGTAHNIFLASGTSRQQQHLPLVLASQYTGSKVMDVLMDLEVENEGYGKALLKEFFPGEQRPAEKKWWEGERKEYDEKRAMKGRKASEITATAKVEEVE